MRNILAITATVCIFLTSCASSMMVANNPQAESNSERAAQVSVTPSANVNEEDELTLNEVPTLVLASLKKAYPSETIEEITKITVNEAVYYQFEIKKGRKKNKIVVFNSNAVEQSSINAIAKR